MTKLEKHVFKARIRQWLETVLLYAVTIPVAAVVGAFVFVFILFEILM